MSQPRPIELIESVLTSDGSVPRDTYSRFWALAKNEPRFATLYCLSLTCKFLSIAHGSDRSCHRPLREDFEEFARMPNEEDESPVRILPEEERRHNLALRFHTIQKCELLLTPNGLAVSPEDPALTSDATAVRDGMSFSGSTVSDARSQLVRTHGIHISDRCRRPSEISYIAASTTAFKMMTMLRAETIGELVGMFEKSLKYFTENVPVQWRNLLHSLLFCALYLPVDRKDMNLRVALSYWTRCTRFLPLAEDLLFLLSPVCWDDKFRLIQMATDADAMSGSYFPFRTSEDISYPFVTSPSMVLPRLEHLFCDSDALGVEHFLSSIAMMLEQPGTQSNRVLNLFFLIETLYARRSNIGRSITRKMLETLRPYLTWSSPYGTKALSLVRKLGTESEFKGFVSRDVLARSFRVSADRSKIEPMTVHVLVNHHAARVDNFLRQLALVGNSLTMQPEVMIANGILGFLRAHSESVAHGVIEVFQSIPQLVILEKLAPRILPEAFLSEIDRSGIMNVLSQIQEFVEKAKEGEFGEVLSTSWMPNHACRALCMRMNVVLLDDEIDLTARPRIGKTQFESVLVPALMSILEEEKASQWIATGNIAHDKITIVLAGGDGTLQHFVSALHGLISKRSDLQDMLDRVVVHILPLGIRNTLSSYISQFDPFFRRHVHLPYQFALSVLPEASSADTNVANTASSKAMRKLGIEKKRRGVRLSGDSSTGFGSDMVPGSPTTTPSLSLSSPGSPSATDTPADTSLARNIETSLWQHSSPADVLHDGLLRYVADATEMTEVCMYRCECWTYDVPKGRKKGAARVPKLKDYVIMPFACHAQVGLTTEALRFKKERSLFAVHVSEVPSMKGFKYDPSSLKMTLTECHSHSGVAHKTDTSVPSTHYARISVIGVMHFTDKPSQRIGQGRTTPSSPTLEVHTIDYDRKRKIMVVGSDRYFHVNALKLESEDMSDMYLMLDGEVYGPYQKLRFSILDVPGTKGKENLSFQMAHFLPMDT
eukprot:TRINITY_DN6418_c0_g1_i1.p1 TRINITY_DN6418_c0_g1~~TRINITY_DN6418_c0_g1_i1.p1  ORF type:complete len:999 (-),score=227.92 TRINITY_DN6418_c0_g1_i1:89-3085(-)